MVARSMLGEVVWEMDFPNGQRACAVRASRETVELSLLAKDGTVLRCTEVDAQCSHNVLEDCARGLHDRQEGVR